MTNNLKEAEVQNVNQDGLSKIQLAAKDKAVRIQEILNEEPKMALYPFTRFHENGGQEPAVRLVEVKIAKDESNKETKGDSGNETSTSTEQSAGEQPAESPDTGN